MDKQALRERTWDALEAQGVARFPFPPHGRIPNFAGADAAAERLQGHPVWRAADTVKANPDAPQLPVRRAALRAGKTLYMAVPQLREEECFLRLDPAAIDDVDHATTVGGSAEVGVPVAPEAMPAIDLVVSGSVAVRASDGARVGKGEGYADLEFAVLREFGLVDDDTVTATTVHELQVLDDETADEAVDALDATPQDVPMDVLCTPERTVEPAGAGAKPSGIAWERLDDERIAEIPVLGTLRCEAPTRTASRRPFPTPAVGQPMTDSDDTTPPPTAVTSDDAPTDEPVHVAAICGSLRDESTTRVALRHALAAARSAGAETDLIDLRDLDLPVYDADEDPAGDAPALTRRIRAADAVLLGTPMYHGSYASPLKTALDYCGFDEFENKTVGLLAVAGGRFPITALDHLRSVCRALDAWVLPHEAAVPNSRSAVEAGDLADDGVAERVATLGRRSVQYARIEPEPMSFEGAENVGAVD